MTKRKYVWKPNPKGSKCYYRGIYIGSIDSYYPFGVGYSAQILDGFRSDKIKDDIKTEEAAKQWVETEADKFISKLTK